MWTTVITCHLRRPPVASALAALDGIRRGLHPAAPAPADAGVGDARPSASSAYGRLRVGALVPSPRGRPRGPAAPTQKPPIASAETLHLLRDPWPVKPSTTGTWPIADSSGAARRVDRVQCSGSERPFRPLEEGAGACSSYAEATYRKRRNASSSTSRMADETIHHRDLADRRLAWRSPNSAASESAKPRGSVD